MTREDAISVAIDWLERTTEEDGEIVIGLHPVFGWVYRGAEDAGSLAELTRICHVSLDGVEEEPETYEMPPVEDDVPPLDD